MAETPIYSVDSSSINTWLNKKNPPSLGVSATGLTRTGGWTNARLAPRVYVTPPEDGVQEFDFHADAPSGMVIQALMPIAGMGGLDPAPDWLRGVRVIAETNEAELLFGPALAGEALHAFAMEPEQGEPGPERRAAEADASFLGSIEPAAALFSAAGAQCTDITLLSIDGIPEYKQEMRTVCVAWLFGKCVAKTDLPQYFRRNSKIIAYAQVCHPSLNDLLGDVRDCLKQAVGAGVLAGVFTGNPGAVAPALKAYLIACLKVKTGKALDDLELSVGTRKEAGGWTPY
ncbi:hypothetical protein ACWCOP_12670 [Maricaulaceae bacterium MS644]